MGPGPLTSAPLGVAQGHTVGTQQGVFSQEGWRSLPEGPFQSLAFWRDVRLIQTALSVHISEGEEGGVGSQGECEHAKQIIMCSWKKV